jgi:ATP-dependent Lon protease
MVIGGLNLGGSIEPLYNAVADKGAKTLLMPVTSRKQLVELDDDLATRVTVVYYGDPRDALFKALLE